jgi:hypothetical protein
MEFAETADVMADDSCCAHPARQEFGVFHSCSTLPWSDARMTHEPAGFSTVGTAPAPASASMAIRHVSAHTIDIRGLPGPALLGTSALQVVAIVSGPTGTPVTALPATAFDVREIPSRVTSPSAGVRRRPIADFRDVAPGVYSFTVESSSGAAHALLLTVADDGRGQARTVLRVDA